MSYTKVKSLSRKKDGTFVINGACSSIYPLNYERFESSITPYELFNHILSGGIKLQSGCKQWLYLAMVVCRMYRRQGGSLSCEERASCPLFKKVVDRVMRIPLKKLKVPKYKIKDGGAYVTKFTKSGYIVTFGKPREWDFFSAYSRGLSRVYHNDFLDTNENRFKLERA